MTKMINVLLIIIPSILCFGFGVLFGSNYFSKIPQLNLIYSSLQQFNPVSSTGKKQHIIPSFSYAENYTHLWSMRLADENYFQIARLLPCRNVSYTGGPQAGKVNPCDNSSTNEFSLVNILHGQKWLYEHQHPSDCSNKRFAIIHQFAPSGFGSTMHQVAWALGIALAEDRIAIYKTPGNWVRQSVDSKESISLMID